MAPNPYYPPGLEIADYIPNDKGTLSLVSIFTCVCIAVFTLTYLLVTTIQPRISSRDLSLALWFSLCSAIHLILEGYYTLTFSSLASRTTLLAQLWKEYSLSDSRYLVPNSFVWSMETITAFIWGPLSFMLVLLIALDSPLRYPVQIVVSLGQLYGDVLYYGTCGFEFMVRGVEYSRPERGYFWGYFVFLNLFWVFIPLGCVVGGVRACKKAFTLMKEMDRKDSPMNGTKKKL